MTRSSKYAICRLSAAAIALGTLFPAAAEAADLVVTSYGGLWEQGMRDCYVAEFQKETGKSVEVVLGTNVQWMNQIAASQGGKPPIDVLVNNADTAYEAINRGIVDKIDPTKVPHLVELGSKFVELTKGYGVPVNYGALGITYNRNKIPNPPKTWKDFVDGVISGKYRAAIPHINYPITALSELWLFASLYGGGVDNIQPGLDIIKKMQASGNLVFWNDSNEFPGLIKSGDVDIGMWFDGRTWALVDEGNPELSYLNPAPGAVSNVAVIQKPKGASDLAWKFLDVMASPGPQACFGNLLQYGMTNTNVVFSPKVEPRITKPAEIIFPPFADAPSRVGDWIESWNKQLGG